MGDWEVAAPRNEVNIRVALTDASGLKSEWYVVEGISIGNEAPQAALGVPAGILGGEVVFDLVAADSSTDRVDVEFEFSLPDEPGVYRTGAIGRGNTDNVETDLTGATHIFTWDSKRESSAVLTTPQGVAAARVFGVPVRSRLVERWGGRIVYGGWSGGVLEEIRNQNPPELVRVSASRPPKSKNPGAIPIYFALADEESEFANVTIEYSIDGGQQWFAAVEYLVPQSGGVYQLSTRPKEAGALDHRFYWDVSALSLGDVEETLLRLQAVDGNSEALAPVVVSVNPIRPDSNPWSQRTILDIFPAAGDRSAAFADLTGDGINEIILLGGSSNSQRLGVGVGTQDSRGDGWTATAHANSPYSPAVVTSGVNLGGSTLRTSMATV